MVTADMAPRSHALQTITLATLVVLAGCSLGSPPPSDPKAERIVNETLETFATVDAYTYDIDGSATATRNDQSESIRLAGVGRVNLTARRLSVTLTRPEETTVYLANRTAYAPCPFSHYVNIEDVWYASDQRPETASFRSALELGTRRVLQSGRVYYSGNRTMGGERVHVVTTLPDEATYAEAQSGTVYPEGEPENRGSLQNVSMRLWVDADTTRLLQARVTEQRSVDGGTLRIRQTLTYRYQPVTITLPKTVDSEDACPEP